ncbi:glycosylphosphatidylinositol anchor attachment 1 protein [Tribolium castaneum]|uniref:GPI-anchor transamidase component GPAA1 n=1 Tax=Tribolium castaneum TaxID=7070 RepID=D6WQR2_TRICA|nr:PREDICTED: glycosylphosphatidylinositol anchor attachment 1 protein [Tribolium castaneum]EFA06039.1 Glycosylphosphatidylinositol anchor attachment 1 protein-like Protein [Tribolium castaneum]|eukprot:XP_975265.1 PREDICTED: glycosylphosphatidylinositol anchor attachment 1 protein [Tribolium castaneum]
MGLLTDPSAGQGKLTKALLKYYTKLCVLLYIGGIGWFCSLAYTPMNAGTYFSENALLPGLVKSEFREDAIAKTYHSELLDEMKKYEDSIPYPWLLAKMKQIGLDTYTHNFTLNYPLGKPQKFVGKNVYGILRAARASSTEALVLSVPYRPPLSVHATTAPSIAIMLAFAKFANREKYWAKDIIFLITEHEQLGMQAWLEAYHGVACGNDGTLDHGDIKGRAGAIQAAINLELHETAISQVDIKIEGLNGQLPNLDLFNLAAKMLLKEGVPHTFKNRPNKHLKDPVNDWFYSFQTLLAMISTQATGIPNGNHGLYHRFGIEALTLESTPLKGGNKAGFPIVGRIIEGIFRSLNNLLERFHQSFFFYLLPSSERFISIGLYMPAICLIAGALFIKACANWCQLQENQAETEDEKTKTPETKKQVKSSVKPRDSKNYWKEMETRFQTEIQTHNPPDPDSVNFISILCVFLMSHVLGVLIMNSPQLLTTLGGQYNYSTDASLFYGFIAISVVLLTMPLFIPFKACEKSMSVLNILSLLELGTTLICVSMNNFSLALFCAIIYVPLALIIGITRCRLCSAIKKIVWLLAHPLVVLTATVLVYTFFMFPGEKFEDNFHRGVAATQQAIVFSIVDSMIYGNWLFSVVTSVFISNWLCFWIVAFAKVPQDIPKKKID